MKMFAKKILFSILILIISLYLNFNLIFFKENSSKLNLDKQNVDLIIGILSKPTNFEQRAIIRQTWLSDLELLSNDINVKPFFVIGNSLCNVPNELRSNEYSCERINFNDSLFENQIQIFKLEKLSDDEKKFANINFCNGFIFELNYDLTINKLGILNKIINHHDNKSYILNLKNLLNNEIIVDLSISKLNLTKNETGYEYFNLKSPLNLKKGFIGELFVSNLDNNFNDLIKNYKTNNDKFNLIKIVNLINYNKQETLNDQNLIAISFDYLLTNKTDIKLKLKNLKNLNNKNILDQLEKELEIYNDILFVNIKDIYRNLPDKLLNFLNFINQNYSFKYLIKSDDDTYLNLTKLSNYFKLLQSNRSWFGNFRKNWLVNEYGKWSESNYQSLVYPPFACGSAYALTPYLVNWLSTNSNDLFRYQGEDVSMGIWLASILPDYRNDKRWNCERNLLMKNNEYFSIGQLSTEDQVQLFKYGLKGLN